MATAKTYEWASPRAMVSEYSENFGPFTFDPCASAENTTAPEFLTVEDDGLKQPWKGRIWLNPPYGRIIRNWMVKANEELDSGRVQCIVALLPARTDTRWFHDEVVDKGHEVRFLRGRVRYGEGLAPAPFPSIIVVMKP